MAREMMTEKFSLFYAGFTSFLPSYYYNLQALAENIERTQSQFVKLSVIAFLEGLVAENKDETATHVRTAYDLAQAFELKVPPIPHSFSDFFLWQTRLGAMYEERFPMSRIDHYYFFYGRKNAELYCTTRCIETLLQLFLLTKGQYECLQSVCSYLRENEHILFKLTAASALLGSEPKQTYFAAHLKQLSTAYHQFTVLNEAELARAEIPAVLEEIRRFRFQIMDGFKTCIGTLKNLQ